MASPVKNAPASGNDILGQFRSDLTTRQIEDAAYRSMSIQTMLFVWHCAGNINNRTYNRNRGDMIYSDLPRMELIPVYAWGVPVIRPKNSSFSVGKPTAFMSSLGDTVNVIEQRTMMAAETAKKLKKWYAHEGLALLPSLTTDDDKGKVNAFLLYDAIMRNPANKGVGKLLEHLDKFLETDAPELLEEALKGGVAFVGSNYDYLKSLPANYYPLGNTEEEKIALLVQGTQLIENLRSNLAKTIYFVTNEDTGILTTTRGQLQSAEKQIKDSKARIDKRDQFYLNQLPSFSMQTDVERATNANKELVGAIGQASGVQATSLTALLQQNQIMIEELRAMRIQQEEDRKRLQELEAKNLKAARNASPIPPAV